jgi:hypothetical protein
MSTCAAGMAGGNGEMLLSTPAASTRNIVVLSSGTVGVSFAISIRQDTCPALNRTSRTAGKLSSVSTYRHCARVRPLSSASSNNDGWHEPAAVIGAIANFAREARKDMRNGTRFMSLIAVSALFDVSLRRIGHKQSPLA